MDQHADAAKKRAGLAQKATIQSRLDRVAEKEPTVVGTGKPEGVKKARRSLGEVVVKEREEVESEDALSAYLAAFTQKEQIGRTVLAEGNRQNDILARNVTAT